MTCRRFAFCIGFIGVAALGVLKAQQDGGGGSSASLFSSTAFSISNRGAVSTISAGTTAATSVGYARIQPNTGSSTPPGIAIFGFRQNNVLVSEAGVPASPAISSGRIYAEVGAGVTTGLAIANPNNQTAAITFYFTDQTGTNFGTGSTTIAGGGQIAAFLDQAPFSGGLQSAGPLRSARMCRLLSLPSAA